MKSSYKICLIGDFKYLNLIFNKLQNKRQAKIQVLQVHPLSCPLQLLKIGLPPPKPGNAEFHRKLAGTTNPSPPVLSGPSQ